MSPISLQGLSIGYLAQPGLSRTAHYAVHSSFRHALNLVAETTEAGGWLTLVDAACENLPSGARVSVPPHWDWRAHARQGDRIAVQGAQLRGAGWQVDLAGAACWRPITQRGNGGRPSARALSVRYALAAQRLRAHCAQHVVDGALQWLPGWPAHARAVKLSTLDDAATLAGAVRALVGFGGGLTPDGDDYLLGYLAALWRAHGQPEIESHRHALSAILRAQLHRTNDISRHYLQLALDGHFSEPVDRFLSITSSAEPGADFVDAADAVMSWGAASGVDCLAGILHGMRAWQEVFHMRDAKTSIRQCA
ncbi:hypothetical protein AWB74_06588 [Caballeronia arvi]|uniref:DUF2877 domain-containing protein n=1 Tax=Caballeronia arvi TaxID=1777135 RepID=A0A158KQI4_9BURK|nr:DUF2877 domain-containing protein [Caballeronia arvi]SAL83392.1 hypothetical protein AWB74_06588 [Caballeronia arvi]